MTTKDMSSEEVESLMAQHPDMAGQVQMLWHSNYWDGPLSGYVEVDGAHGFWVHCVSDFYNERADDADDSCSGKDGDGGCDEYPGDDKCCMKTYDRVYLVYKLDEEQDRIVLANHALFQEHVGTHTDYPGGAPRKLGAVKPRATWDLFYKAERPSMPPLREEQAIGYTLRLFTDTERGQE